MKERPILFSGEMVRAILAGQKTQTRRVVMPRHKGGIITGVNPDGMPIESWGGGRGFNAVHNEVYTPCPYGEADDRLWVREKWKPEELASGLDGVRYAADDGFQPIEDTMEAADAWNDVYHRKGDKGRWRPSIHMPRWVCRLVREVTAVRAEPLQNIDNVDAIREGTPDLRTHDNMWDMRQCFRHLWDSINGKRPGCSWQDNPFVWVVTFQTCNSAENL